MKKKNILIFCLISLALGSSLIVLKDATANENPKVTDPIIKVNQTISKQEVAAETKVVTTTTKKVEAVESAPVKVAAATKVVAVAKPVVKPVTKVVTATSKTVTPVATKTTTKNGITTSMNWDASGLARIGKISSFDYSNAIRNVYVKKVEAYARRNNIKVITAAVINGMRE